MCKASTRATRSVQHSKVIMFFHTEMSTCGRTVPLAVMSEIAARRSVLIGTAALNKTRLQNCNANCNVKSFVKCPTNFHKCPGLVGHCWQENVASCHAPAKQDLVPQIFCNHTSDKLGVNLTESYTVLKARQASEKG